MGAYSRPTFPESVRGVVLFEVMKSPRQLGNGETPRPAYEVAADMLELQEQMVREVYTQREEILAAFIAKHGFHPDEAEQIVVPGKSWCVIRLDPERVKTIQREIIRFRMDSKKLSWWQRLLLWMAGY